MVVVVILVALSSFLCFAALLFAVHLLLRTRRGRVRLSQRTFCSTVSWRCCWGCAPHSTLKSLHLHTHTHIQRNTHKHTHTPSRIQTQTQLYLFCWARSRRDSRVTPLEPSAGATATSTLAATGRSEFLVQLYNVDLLLLLLFLLFLLLLFALTTGL